MSVDVCTKYDKNKVKKLLRYYVRYHVMPERSFWIRSAVCVALILMCFFISIGKEGVYEFVRIASIIFLSIYALFAVILLGVYYILVPFILSKIKKNIDGKIIRFSFNEECFKVSENDEEREVSYSTVKRVGKNGKDVYLFTDNVITFIVDTSALSYEELENLRLILKSKFISKYFKWEY